MSYETLNELCSMAHKVRQCPHCGRELDQDQADHCASDDCPRIDLINQARATFANDELEIDDNAQVTDTGDGTGHWVAAWVYVRKEAQP